MTHTKQFLMGMFAAYMGCECEITETQDNITTKTKAKSSGVLSERLHFAGVGLFVHFSKLKPILTPLSEITDNDAMEVAKIMEIPQFERAKLFGCDENNYYTIGRHIKNEIIETCYNDGFYLQGAVIDYLRSRHYDCGYMHISSLIAADLAISSKQI